MSNSMNPVEIPTLNGIPKCLIQGTPRQIQEKVAILLLGVIDFTQYCTIQLTQLYQGTNISLPGIVLLWLESLTWVRTTMKSWILPLQAQFKKIGTLRTSAISVNAGRYKKKEDIFYSMLLGNLKNALNKLFRRAAGMEIDCSDHTLLKLYEGRFSARPLSKIVLEALLFTRKPTMNNPSTWLSTIRAHLYLDNLNEETIDDENSPSKRSSKCGQPGTLAALWTGDHLFTGSSLIRWGSMGKLEIPSSVRINLHAWYRNVRQSRFTQEEQEMLNTFIRSQIEYYRYDIV